MKRFFVGLVCVLLGISILCTGWSFVEGKARKPVRSSLVTENGAFPIVKNKITLKAVALTDPASGITNIENNWFTKYYEEKTNVHIDWDFTIGNPDQLNQKINLILASGDYPDLFLGGYINKSAQYMYGSKGVLIPLNGLIDEYGANIKKMFAEEPTVKSQLTAPDGNIYGLPDATFAYHIQMPFKMWVYTPWLEKLGLKVPTTTEEFYQMLKAFKEKDPNGNGKADEIPLAGALNDLPAAVNDTRSIYPFIMNSFIYYDGTYVYQDKGKINFVGNKAEFREGLRFLHKLYKEGLIAQDALTMDIKQLRTISMAETPVLGACPALFPGSFTVGRANPTDRFWSYTTPISPLAGPKGFRQTPLAKPPITGNRFNVTKNCKYPEVAMRWADWFFTLEGLATAGYGPQVEGPEQAPGWRLAKPGETGADGKQGVWVRFMKTDAQNINWAIRLNPDYMAEKWHSGMVVDVSRNYASKNDLLLYDVTKKNFEPYKADKSVPDLFFSQDSVAELTELKYLLKNAVEQGMAAFVTGAKDLDKDWDSYVTNLNKIGLKSYLKLYQKEYDMNRKAAKK